MLCLAGFIQHQNKQEFPFSSVKRNWKQQGIHCPMPFFAVPWMNTVKNIPSYYYDNLMDTIAQYEKMGLENPFIIGDTNHDNSRQAVHGSNPYRSSDLD